MDNQQSKSRGVKERRLDDMEYADEDGDIFTRDVDVGPHTLDPNYQETKENVVPVYVPPKQCIDANTGIAFSNGDYMYIYNKYDVFSTGDKIKFQLISSEQGNTSVPITGDLVVTKCSEHNIYIVTNSKLSPLSIEQGPTVVTIVVGDEIYNQSGVIWSYDERDKLYRVHTSVDISTGDCKVIFHDGSQVSCDKTHDSLNCITMVINSIDVDADIAKQITTFETWKSKIEKKEKSSQEVDGLSRKSSDKTVQTTGVENKDLDSHECMLNQPNIQIQGMIQDGADINSRLHQAVENNNENIVTMLIDAGCDVNIQNEQGDTPLYQAVENNNENIVKMLIDAGCDVNIHNELGETLYQLGTTWSYHQGYTPLYELGTTWSYHLRYTPLYKAVEDNNEKIVKMLIDAKCDVNIQKDHGETPLYQAAANNNENIVKMLIDAKCDVNIENEQGYTPLYKAVENNNENIVTMLIDAGCEVNIQNVHDDTPLRIAVENNNENIVKMLIDAGFDVKIENELGNTWSLDHTYTPLYKAVENNNENIVKMLIDAGCDVNINNLWHSPPFIKSIYNYMSGHCNITHMLLQTGCDVTLSRRPGLKVLLEAAKARNKDLIDLLIQHKADVLTQHEHNKLQLVEFIPSQNDLDSLEFLIQSGLYINTVTDTGDNIFHLFARVYFEYSYYSYNWLLDLGLNVTHVNNLGNTPLMIAAFLNNKPFLEFLTELSCNVNIQNDEGHTALYMCIIGFTFIKETLNKNLLNRVVTEVCSFNYYPVYIQCVDILLSAGADVNIQEKGGKTVLMLAAMKNDKKLLQKLVNTGADVNILDNDGRLALQYLDFNKNDYDLTCFKLLVSNGVHHLLNLPDHHGNTIIQNMLLFPCLWHPEQTYSFISYLVANNVSLTKLKAVCGDNYYNDIRLNEFSIKDRNSLRTLLFVTGASLNEVLEILNFEKEDQNASVQFNVCFNNKLSLKSLSRRIIRQNLGLGIQQKVLQLEVPRGLPDYILLKDILPDKYYNIDLFDDGGYVDDDDFNAYDLNQDVEHYQGYDDKYYNHNTFYYGLIGDDDNDEDDYEEWR